MRYFIICLVCAFPSLAISDAPTIVGSEVSGNRVSVTLLHPDTGWDDYADGWRIELEDGTIIGTRELLHPHVYEQPFTRSLTLEALPDAPLFVRAKDSVGGWAKTRVPLDRD